MTKYLFLVPCVQRPAEDLPGLGSHLRQCTQPEAATATADNDMVLCHLLL